MKKKGFTLIELMVVIAIIGLLAAIALPKFSDVTDQAKAANVQGNLATNRTAIAMFYAKANEYPVLADKEDTLSTVTGTVDTSILFTDYYGKTIMADTPVVSSTYAASNDITGVTTAGNAFSATGVNGGWAYRVSDGAIRANLPSTAYGQGIDWTQF